MADVFKIGSLNDALDLYLSKIDKVNMSVEVLTTHKGLLTDLQALLTSIDAKIASLSGAGGDTSRAAMLSSIRSGVVGGADVGLLLQQESRAANLTRGGSASVRLTSEDRELARRVSAGVRSAGIGSTLSGMSPAMLAGLSAWGSRQGSGPVRGGVGLPLEDSMYALGKGLTPDHLVKDLELDASQESMERSYATIEATSDAILASLGKPRVTGGSKVASAPVSKPVLPSRSSSWLKTLGKLGGVVGLSVGVLEFLGNDSVQTWIRKNLMDSEGRARLFSGVTDAVSSWVSTFKEWLPRFDAIYNKYINGDPMNVREATQAYASASRDTYSSFVGNNSMGSLGERQYSSTMRDLSGSKGFVPVGMSSIGTAGFEGMLKGLGVAAATAGGLRLAGGIGTLGALVKLLYTNPYSAALATAAAAGVWGYLKTQELRKSFNEVSIQYALSHNRAVVWVFTGTSGDAPEQRVLAEWLLDEGGTLYGSMSSEDQRAYAQGVTAELVTGSQASLADRLRAAAPGKYVGTAEAWGALSADERLGYFSGSDLVSAVQGTQASRFNDLSIHGGSSGSGVLSVETVAAQLSAIVQRDYGGDWVSAGISLMPAAAGSFRGLSQSAARKHLLSLLFAGVTEASRAPMVLGSSVTGTGFASVSQNMQVGLGNQTLARVKGVIGDMTTPSLLETPGQMLTPAMPSASVGSVPTFDYRGTLPGSSSTTNTTTIIQNIRVGGNTQDNGASR